MAKTSRWTPRRIKAHDHRRTSIHEAGHAVVSTRWADSVEAWIYEIEDRGEHDNHYAGQCSFVRAEPEFRPHIGIAGMVAEHVWRTRHFPEIEHEAMDYIDLLNDPDCMSETDWAMTGCEPGYPTEELIDVAVTVAEWLRGEMRAEWLSITRSIMRDGRYAHSFQTGHTP